MTFALVTGASSGLGSSLAVAVGRAGFAVLAAYREDRPGAEATVRACGEEGIEARAIQLDLGNSAELGSLLEPYKEQVSCLVNCVGPYLIKPALETEVTQWRQLFESNLFAPLALIQALELSLKRHKGSVINIGVAGLHTRRADTLSPAYRLAKDALYGLTRILSRDLAPFGVRVNMVSPGQLEGSADFDSETPRRAHRPPMGRLGTYHDVSQAVRFLLQPESGYITGQNIEVAGGYAL